jgi:hypothetical protein
LGSRIRYVIARTVNAVIATVGTSNGVAGFLKRKQDNLMIARAVGILLVSKMTRILQTSPQSQWPERECWAEEI